MRFSNNNGTTTITAKFQNGYKLWVDIPTYIVSEYEKTVAYLSKSEFANMLIKIFMSQTQAINMSYNDPASLRRMVIEYMLKQIENKREENTEGNTERTTEDESIYSPWLESAPTMEMSY